MKNPGAAVEFLLQARADVERIAEEFWAMWGEIHHHDGAGYRRKWHELPASARERHCEVIRALLLADVIRVGYTPRTGPPPMEGQTTIETGD